MKKIILHSGFQPEVERKYKGQPIQRIVAARKSAEDEAYEAYTFLPGEAKFYKLENGGWITDKGGERYVTNWTGAERWSRVEEAEIGANGEVISSRNVGFVVNRVDRAAGIL